MIKRISLSLILVFALCPVSYADEYKPAPGKPAEIEAEGTALRKLQRGFLNVVLSPAEISKSLSEEMRVQDAFPPSWFTGIGRGAGNMVVRALAGAVEIVTFPFPIPSNYAPILYPEFPMELADSKPTAIE